MRIAKSDGEHAPDEAVDPDPEGPEAVAAAAAEAAHGDAALGGHGRPHARQQR